MFRIKYILLQGTLPIREDTDEWVKRKSTAISNSLKKRISQGLQLGHKHDKLTFKGYTHSVDSKIKMSNSHIGEKNSQYGSFWINNGVIAKKCRGEIPKGWSKGRKLID